MKSLRSGCPRLAIITPVYNDGANLESYFEAVSWTFLSREDLRTSVILVDDGSSD